MGINRRIYHHSLHTLSNKYERVLCLNKNIHLLLQVQYRKSLCARFELNSLQQTNTSKSQTSSQQFLFSTIILNKPRGICHFILYTYIYIYFFPICQTFKWSCVELCLNRHSNLSTHSEHTYSKSGKR